MRILVDCTNTATYLFKNTGIHRVVRQITHELPLCQTAQAHEIILVKFDGNGLFQVENLNNKQIKKNNYELSLYENVVNKILIYFRKIKNKILRLIPNSFFKLRTKKVESFMEKLFSSNDIYIVADANWDLPGSYHIFLKKLKSHGVSINIICYDLIPIKFPEYCSQEFVKVFKRFYFEYADCFDKVICISKTSAEDYQNILGSYQRKNQTITHFKLGCDYVNTKTLENLNLKSTRPEIIEILSCQYILVVGSLLPHKNIKGIILAINLIFEKTSLRPYLIFAGNKGWHSETDNIIESHPQYNQLIHVFHSVSDQELDLLYRNCYCLVQGSLYEGYGLTVVEAMQYHKPVICSNSGSLPEVGGDFCLYFDPYKPEELYQALVSLLDSVDQYTQIVQNIRMNYKPITWAESAHQLLDILLA